MDDLKRKLHWLQNIKQHKPRDQRGGRRRKRRQRGGRRKSIKRLKGRGIMPIRKWNR